MTGKMAGGSQRPAHARAALVLAMLGAALAGAGEATAAVTIEAAATTHTGASYTAVADASDPAGVVLYEWDFDGDGAVDVNRTDGPEADFVFEVPKPDYRIHLVVTRLSNGSLVVESAEFQVSVANGTPTVAIDLPDRLVSGVPLVFTARANDPDPSPRGEAFSYRWTLDGVEVGGGAERAEVTVHSPGAHEIAVEVTDAEGLSAAAATAVVFGAAGPFEGKAGVVNLGLLTSATALAIAMPLVAMRRREARETARAEASKAALAQAEAASEAAYARGAPRKAPFAAASSSPARAAPHISVGGAPAPFQRTRECTTCHNAVDAALADADCPHCKADDEAATVEKRLEEPPYDALDLSEVKAVLQRARRERHLGRLDTHPGLLAEATRKADALVEDRAEADRWLPVAREKVERARGGGPAEGEAVERAEAYLMLADSMARAKQYAKAARHAKRAAEFLDEGSRGEAGAALQAGPAAVSPADADDDEERVRAEIHALRGEVAQRSVELDLQALELLNAVEEFERSAHWAQALEVLRALREKLARSHDASQSEDAAHPPEGRPQP